MIPRRQIPVTSIAAFPTGAKIRIIHVGDGFHAHCDGVVIAACKSAKRLSDWAFEHGADEVRHDYDGKLSDGEP